MGIPEMLDELKQKWMELSEQVEKNELLNRQIIIDMRWSLSWQERNFMQP